MNSSVFTFILFNLCLLYIKNVQSLKKKVIVLNEDNWRDSLDGEWMIKL